MPEVSSDVLSEGAARAASLADLAPVTLAGGVSDADLFATAHSPQGGAQAKRFPPASASSLAASELYAVDSTLDHLMSIEDSTSEAAFPSGISPPALKQQSKDVESASAPDLSLIHI